MIEIGGNEWWWLLLLFVPLINVIVILEISIDVAKVFGQGLGFGLGLWLLSFVFWPLLGFGDYEYQGAPGEGTGPISAPFEIRTDTTSPDRREGRRDLSEREAQPSISR